MPVDMEGISAGSIAIIRDVRLPRVLLGFLTGAALAVCGASYQGIFKNPMADPYILGISSGAALGAAIGIVLQFSGNIAGLSGTAFLAFAGALLTVFLVYSISRTAEKSLSQSDFVGNRGQPEPFGLYVSDYAVSSAEYGPDYVLDHGQPERKRVESDLYHSALRDPGSNPFDDFGQGTGYHAVGEDTAVQLGVNVEFVKKKVLIVSSIVTAAVVSATGIIGFVGLLVPHVVRLFTGPKHRVLMPVSLLFGGTFLILCDTAARSMITQEIPVGIITAAFGGPFFLYLLWKSRRGGAAG